MGFEAWGSRGSIGTHNASNVYMYMTLIWSGSQGSLSKENVWNWIDHGVSHIVAPMAHWGPSMPWMVWCTKFRYMVIPRAHGGDIKWLPGLIGTQNIWKWLDRDMVHIVAPMAHWGPRTPGMARWTGCWSMVAPEAQWGWIMHWAARWT